MHSTDHSGLVLVSSSHSDQWLAILLNLCYQTEDDNTDDKVNDYDVKSIQWNQYIRSNRLHFWVIRHYPYLLADHCMTNQGL